MSQRSRFSRRRFLRTAAGAVAAPYIVSSSALGLGAAVAPSARIVMGTIGIKSMGAGNTRALMGNKDVQYVAICDVDQHELAGGVSNVNKHYKNEDCKGYKDFRELLARDDIDAVCIATPDHWHALCCVTAAKAKKHIYCQKPMTHMFAEGQAVVRAVKENGVIFQVGSQQRSQGKFRNAARLIRNGVIGKVKSVEVGLPTGHREYKKDTSPQEPPAYVDYDFWCGPSVKLPFHPDRFHWNWRWHLAYGGGQLMDWIGHHNDIAHWGLDMDRSGPIEVKAVGFEYMPDRTVWNSAWQYDVQCKYEGGITTSISNRNRQGCKWIGEDGWVFVSRGAFEASNPEWTKGGFKPGDVEVYDSPEHHRNFLDGIGSGKQCICPAETGHRSITPGHIGLVSEALGGRTIRWDPKNEKVIGDEEAEKALKKVDFRKPWSL